MDTVPVGQLVRDIVDLIGLSISEAARQAGLSRPTFDMLYRGISSNTSYETAKKVRALWKLYEAPIAARRAENKNNEQQGDINASI